MQSSCFLGSRLASSQLVSARPSTGCATRQVTTCMAKKKGRLGGFVLSRSMLHRLGSPTRVCKTPLVTESGFVRAGVRCIVTLECTEARAENGTPSRYTTQKVWHSQQPLPIPVPLGYSCSCYTSCSRPQPTHCLTYCLNGAAEPEKHIREAGAQEVQQVP